MKKRNICGDRSPASRQPGVFSPGVEKNYGQLPGGMKSWLDLIPVSGRVRRRQSRMTRVCIVLAVALVSVLFGMADMAVVSQKLQAIKNDGNWHVAFRNLSREQEAVLAARPEVEQTAWYDVVNYRLDQGYRIGGTETVICGMEEAFLEIMSCQIEEGRFPEEENEAILTKGARTRLGLKAGDTVALALPDGKSAELTVSGFAGDTAMLTDKDAFGVFVNRGAFGRLSPGKPEESPDGMIYTRFVPRCSIQRAIADIQTQLGLEEGQAPQNARLLGLMGQSSDNFIQGLYLVAAVLAVLVIVAGILMITGSLNSNIAQRTGFFGMLRCLGATPGQVRRFVLLEALDWCKMAVPAGLLLSVAVVWALCTFLRVLNPVWFGEMPAFGVSLGGICAGAVLGVVTVLLAAQSPAKKAARVSPLTAVSGNAGGVHAAKRAASTGIFGVETALGVHHARGSRKNFWLMTGSFAFTIILFLSFSASIDFMNHALTALKPYTPDLSVASPDNTCSVPAGLAAELSQNPAVKRAYGRRFAYNVPVLLDGQEGYVNLISYEAHQFAWAKDMLVEGELESVENGSAVMIGYAYAGGNLLKPGSVISLQRTGNASGGMNAEGDALDAVEIGVAAVLSECPFDRVEGVETVICSEALFERLTGQTDYTVLDVQLNRSAADQDVEKIRQMAGDGFLFSDKRQKNREGQSAWYSYAVFLYGFLAVIALIAGFNIVNSIAMSVSARIRQYGAMRAVGMENGQLVRMVAAEALTYACAGVAAGGIVGLWLHHFVFTYMVTVRWGDAWYLPVRYIVIILSVVAVSVFLAIIGPARRIRRMSIVDTIGDC